MEATNGSASDNLDRRTEARTTDDNAEPPVSPPYWQLAKARADSNLSDVPSASRPSIRNKNRLSGPIRLFDNSEEDSSDNARACWARSARIDDYVIISGSKSKAGLGSYVVWNCTVETLNVSRNSTSALRTYYYSHALHVPLEAIHRTVELTDLTGWIVQDTKTLFGV